MSSMPKDPVILLSLVNAKLGDNYKSITELGKAYMVSEDYINTKLNMINYSYNKDRNQFV